MQIVFMKFFFSNLERKKENFSGGLIQMGGALSEVWVENITSSRVHICTTDSGMKNILARF